LKRHRADLHNAKPTRTSGARCRPWHAADRGPGVSTWSWANF